MPWPTVNELRAYLPTSSPLTDAEVLDVALTCQEAIESICGQAFVPVTEAREFSGAGEQVLNVRRAVQSVSEVRILGCPPGSGDQILDISDLRITESRLMIAMGNVVPKPYRAGRRLSGGSCSYFPWGLKNIRVTGTWGEYADVPREIKRALGLLVRHVASCDDPVGSHAEAYESESVAGDRSWTLRKVWTNVTQNAMTGFPDVDSILVRYYVGPSVTAI